MEKQSNLNNDFSATIVTKLLLGKSLMSKNITNNIGLNYGLLKATVFVS